MKQWTTPENIFSTDVDLSQAEVIYVTYKQQNKIIIKKQKEDLSITENSVSITLSQQETGLFNINKPVRIQIRARFSDGLAIASNIINTRVEEVLKTGVI